MKPVPESIRRLAAQGNVALSDKAERRLADDGFSFDDLLTSIIEGSVVKKEIDQTGVARYKYVIIGPSLSGRLVYSCGKVVSSNEGQEYFVITAHGADR